MPASRPPYLANSTTLTDLNTSSIERSGTGCCAEADEEEAEEEAEDLAPELEPALTPPLGFFFFFFFAADDDSRTAALL